MLVFNQGRLTVRGKELLANVQGGQERIKFTRIAFGSGLYTSTEDITDRVGLKDERQSFPISSRTINNRVTVTLKCVLTNRPNDDDVLTEGYDISEAGVFAENAAGEEILYAIFTTKVSDRMPAYDGHIPSQMNFTCTLEVGDASTVEIVSSGSLASSEELNAHIDTKVSNEHGVHGLRYYNKSLQVEKENGEWETASADNAELETDVTALMVAVTLMKGSAIDGTSGNIVVETFDTANDFVIVSGQYDKQNKRLFA